MQVLSSGRTTFATDIRISILPGVNSNHKKRYRKKRNLPPSVDQNNQKVHQQFKRSTSANGLSYFPKITPRYSWTSINKDRHRLDQNIYGNFAPFNDTFSSEYSSGLNYPYQEVINANYQHRLHNSVTKIPPQKGNTISIGPSSTASSLLKSIENSNRRTIVPYNYLDDMWDPEDYTLQIKYTKRRDSGTYICQVNTEPRVAQAIRLKVVGK